MLKLLIALIAMGVLAYGGYLVREVKATEQLSFKVLQSSADGIELRQYAPFIVAEIDVKAENARQAASIGFRPLAGYIFGDNAPQAKIAMTAPVTTQAKSGEKIAMTAPVTTAERSDGVYTVQFSMPSEWTIETLPTPANNLVRLIQKPALLRLAKIYRGETTLEDMAIAEEALKTYAADNGMIITQPAIWAGYSSPMVPKPMRKWEMLVTVER